MGGGGSKVFQDITPRIEWYNVYANIPANAEQQINQLNAEIRIKRDAYHIALGDLATAKRREAVATTDRNYWKGEVQRLQQVIDGLLKDIAGLEADLAEIKRQTQNENTIFSTNNGEHGILSTLNKQVRDQTILYNASKGQNLNEKQTVFYAIHSQNSRLNNQYNEHRNGLTKK